MNQMGDASRFEQHVDRSGKHHLWLGSTNPLRGTGRLKVNGKQMTAHRRAWELAYGTPDKGIAVSPCPQEPLCVRVDHLSITMPISKKQKMDTGKHSRNVRKPAPKATRVQVQANGQRVHRRVRGDRNDVEQTRAQHSPHIENRQANDECL